MASPRRDFYMEELRAARSRRILSSSVPAPHPMPPSAAPVHGPRTSRETSAPPKMTGALSAIVTKEDSAFLNEGEERSFHDETDHRGRKEEEKPAAEEEGCHVETGLTEVHLIHGMKRCSSAVTRRRSALLAQGSLGGSGWRDLVLESLATRALDDDNEGPQGHGHEGGGKIPFYAPPLQRQRWGEDQSLPHINWGDLFFDLFYVAAAYNLGRLLISAMTPDAWFHGIVYFVGIFGPLFNMWESKLVYESRYAAVDYTHRLIEVVRVFFLSFSVLHITALDLMTDPRSAETFGFCLGIFLECLVRIGLKVELVRVGKGDVEAIRNHSKRKLLVSYVPLALFYGAAMLIAAVQLWGSGGKDDTLIYQPEESGHGYGSGYDSKQPGYESGYEDTYNKTDASGHDGYSEYDDGEHRLLGTADPAEDSSALAWSANDIPIILCLVAYVFNAAFTLFRKTVLLPSSSDFRRENVPSNIDFNIHRYGEWTMLMLGEVVLSLIIVDTTETQEYYVVAMFGALTVILIQALHFESEPSHADRHALWRNMRAGVVYSDLLQLLSMALIAFGVSYKVMLKSIHKATETMYKEAAKRGMSHDGGDAYYGYGGSEEDAGGHRRLAPSISVTNLAAAALFCGSLTAVLVSLELMTQSHGGIRQALRQTWGDGRRNVLTLLKLALILFTATLSQWLVHPVWISVAGFFIAAAYAAARVAGWNLVNGNGKVDDKPQGGEGGAEAPESAVQ